MGTRTFSNRNYGKAFRADAHLLKSSLWIMATSMFGAATGFLFWIAAANLYEQEALGAGTVLMSSVTLCTLLSRIGLDQSLIRYVPTRDASSVVSTVSIITAIVSCLVSCGVLACLFASIPWLSNEGLSALLIPLVVIVCSATSTSGVAFVALRRAKFYFAQSAIATSRIAFLPIAVTFGGIGILLSYGLSQVLVLLFSFALLLSIGIKPSRIDTRFVKDSFQYSLANYVVEVLTTAPALLLPIMVARSLGPADTARYYVAYTISSFLFMIPGSVSTALFVFGSYGEDLRKNTRKALVYIASILLPLVLALWCFGNKILGIFGADYVASFALLKTFLIAAFLVTAHNIFFSVCRVQRRMGSLVFIGLINFTVVLLSSFLFMGRIGVLGVGYGWLTGYGTGVVIIAGLIASKRNPLKSL